MCYKLGGYKLHDHLQYKYKMIKHSRLLYIKHAETVKMMKIKLFFKQNINIDVIIELWLYKYAFK
jgi:ribosomal protein S10